MSEIAKPAGLDAVIAKLKELDDNGLYFHETFPTFDEFLKNDQFANLLPKIDPTGKSEYRVMADYLIAAPVIGVDFSPTSETYGQVVGYIGNYNNSDEVWVCAESLQSFLIRLEQEGLDIILG